MKRLLQWLGLPVVALATGFAVGRWTGSSHPAVPTAPADRTLDAQSGVPPLQLTLSAVIDGSGRFIFTPDIIWHEHGHWQPPKNVLFNGEPWPDLSVPPAAWDAIAKGLDLPKATIVARNGRDVIALEPTENGFDLYFADSPMGSATYEVTLLIPSR